MIFRVMTYNILYGGEDRELLIREVIESVQPDSVVLQEVWSDKLIQGLAQALNMQGYFANSNVRSHVCFLSRHPVRQWHSHLTFPPLLHNAIEAEIEFRPGRILRLIGVHPVAFLGWPFEVWRMWEARHIVGLINHRREPCLIAGDFNAIAPEDRVDTTTMPRWLKLMLMAQGNRPSHFAMRRYLAAGFTDCFRHLNPPDDGFTLPPPTPNSRLDYILVNDALKPFLKKCWVVREPEAVLKASDHYPVVAEFDM